MRLPLALPGVIAMTASVLAADFPPPDKLPRGRSCPTRPYHSTGGR